MKKGISLYELLIVMSIIAIIAVITVPLISAYSSSLKLSSSARVVSTKLRQAQEEAVTTQIKHLVRFNPTTTPPSLQFIKLEATETVLETATLAQGTTMSLDSSITSSQIIFSPDGGPSATGNITITLGSASKIISVSAAGVIKLQ